MIDLLDFARQYGSLITSVFAGFVGCVAWWLSRNFASKKDLNSLENKVNEDIEKLEIKVDNLASSEEVKNLNKSMHEMQKILAVFTEKFDHIDKDNKRLTIVTDRIENYLRNQK